MGRNVRGGGTRGDPVVDQDQPLGGHLDMFRSVARILPAGSRRPWLESLEDRCLLDANLGPSLVTLPSTAASVITPVLSVTLKADPPLPQQATPPLPVAPPSVPSPPA